MDDKLAMKMTWVIDWKKENAIPLDFVFIPKNWKLKKGTCKFQLIEMFEK